MGATLVFAISLGMSIATGVGLFLAVNTLLNGVGAFVASSFIGEVFGILSVCLPFSLVQLLSGFSAVAVGIISFWTARKIFSILMDVLGGTTA